MMRLSAIFLLTLFALLLISRALQAQSAFRLPAVLMINFLNRTQQIAYAIGMSNWEMMKAEARGLAEEAAAYGKIVPPGIPMGKSLKEFREDVAALLRAADSRDREGVGRSFGRIEAGCMTCHKRYR
ncbi:MAG: cytochrome c, partial [Nitrospinota bacterium]